MLQKVFAFVVNVLTNYYRCLFMHPYSTHYKYDEGIIRLVLLRCEKMVSPPKYLKSHELALLYRRPYHTVHLITFIVLIFWHH